ncbi:MULTISPECIES: CDP-alcohol phosphatidyltransferase family protein [unclassified Sphingomonas]|uniref:CDP-alcohol phosphatidyltransferase family protein n=1 Tax=unclassified Sphingomonas TaxID=196159 RepID=UPI001D106D94|nr:MULTISPECIES: CDP-alcohol phosphatidyltransferase family protein [unclassified Sphingomonas]MCC2978710.1 CDP-alcohol phosphatidyltransferase family protein [Sphingomonas sp. IC4-52]MCD2316003.1 CDP-alcohol phosphatidyltransferase family protein [Sphingomonas sp. IC-11]
MEVRPTVTGKPRELQGFLNRTVYHPAARRLANALVPTRVTPNMVSVFGAVMVIAAGVLYAKVGTAGAILTGFAIHLLWHVVDGADGDLARLTGRASANGEVVDGLCDYGGHVALYLLLGSTLDDTLGGAAWVLAVAAGASRIAQSVFAESSRRSYQWWAYGVPWLQHNRARPAGIGGALGRIYLAASAVLVGATSRINALVASAEVDPTERQRIARLAREAGPSFLSLPGMLGANPRTIILGLSMLAGSPLWFFLVEITLLNLLLVTGIARQHAQCRRLVDLIGRGRN